MTAKAKLTILGCGNSSGVPAAGNYWGQCDPDEPKNNRTRCSICIQTDKTSLVVDTGQDFRIQLNRENINRLDAVLYSHEHGDHVHGIDDLRPLVFQQKRKMPVYGSKSTFRDLKKRFEYMFDGGTHDIYPPLLDAHVIKDFGKSHRVGDIKFIPFRMDHGSCISTGYRFGDAACSVDMLTLDETAINTLKGIKTWIVDSAAYKNPSNKVHACLDKIYELNTEIKAETVILTSLSLSMDYQTLRQELPEGYIPAYDGLKLDVAIS